MTDLVPALQDALRSAVRRYLAELAADGAAGGDAPGPLMADADVDTLDVPVQGVPDDQPGDYGSPVAFGLARALRRNPAQIAARLAVLVRPPEGVARVAAVGPYLNVDLDPGSFVRAVVDTPLAAAPRGRKIVIEHTSVNPNKEAHVGHLRNIVLGDALARIERAAGFEVEVQNYIDDTGRQAAESLYAMQHFGERDAGGRKYDHWLGELYVRLGAAKDHDGAAIEEGVTAVMHALERGELRAEVERVVRAQLETSWSLGVEYDLLVWESDVVASGFLQRGLEVLEALPSVSRPSDGKYAGALVMDVSAFLPGLEEPLVVLVRSDGNAMYVTKDIGYHLWKVGRLEGLRYRPFATQPSGATLWTSAPDGEAEVEGRRFAHGDQAVNVIDARQAHPQTIVRTALQMTSDDAGAEPLHHLAYEVVTLEGQPMSGRKGITLAIDTVIEEAIRRARAVVEEKNPDLAAIDEVARAVGLGALRFAMLKSEARRVIDFRWEQALSLAGDSAPYVQYAHARAASILRTAGSEPAGSRTAGAQWSRLGPLEVRLARELARWPGVLRAAAEADAPHVVAQYALDLATTWNAYYNHRGPDGKPDTSVVRAEPGLREARLALVATVRDALAFVLGTLGIAAPEQM
jgi:arginyl-tRNA synthetase